MSANTIPEGPDYVEAEAADPKTTVKLAFAAWLKKPTPANAAVLTAAQAPYLAAFKAQLLKDFS